MAFKTSEKYKSVIYSGDCRHKLKLLFNGVELDDADVYCESLKVTSRIIPNGSTRFSLDNFIAKEAEIILHDIDTTIIQSPVNISIGTLVDGTYEYVPIGLFVVQDLPTTDKNKTTIKLRDYAVKFDFGYNAKDIIDENGGSVTKLQILQDICNKAGVETDITKFYGSNSKIGIYDNSITARTYISYLAEQAGAIATIDRSGKLIFVQLKDLETVEIPLNIVEKYEDGEKYEISRVVYEDAIRKFEYGDESKDTLFINTANPYIDDEVLTNTLSGSKIETSDSADAEVVNYKQYGITKQETSTRSINYCPDIDKWSLNNEAYIENGYIVLPKNTANAASPLIPIDKQQYFWFAYAKVYTEIENNKLLCNTEYYDGDKKRLSGNGNAVSIGTVSVDNNYYWTFGGGSGTQYGQALYNAKYIRILFSNSSNYSNGAYKIKCPMITSERQPAFVPYVPNMPSPDYPSEIEVATGSVSVKSTGKNLFNEENIVNLALSDKIIYNSSYKGYYTSCKEGDVFSLSRNDTINNRFRVVFTTEEPANGVEFFGGTGQTTAYDNSLKIENIVAPKNANYIFVYLSNKGDELPSEIQLEKSSVATDYEPYKESSITYNLGDNFLADKDFIENGVLNKKIGKVVLDGSENWANNENIMITKTNTIGFYKW